MVFVWGSIATAAPLLPDFSSAVFDASLVIDNPFFPLTPGMTYTYDAESIDTETGEVESELNIVEVLEDTRTVLGVLSRVVRDRAWVEGVLLEDTFDWYAQDRDGNVWYMGELATNYEYDDDGNFIGTNNEGSWEAGVDGAQAGYIMEANRIVADNYYQEWYPGHALDQAEILSLDESVTISLGTFTGVVQTKETSELAPELFEHKFYAAGVGHILAHELDEDTGEIVGTSTLRSVVPEPASLAPLMTGAACLLATRRMPRPSGSMRRA
jgi:hypothetical protein